MTHELQNCKKIALNGELDHHTASDWRDKLDRQIAGKKQDMLLDFAGVTLMDSSGIGLVIGRYKKLKERGCTLYVTNLNKQIDRVFSLSGLYNIAKKV